MLFNSYEFLFVFLPLTVAGYFLLGRFGSATVAKLWLILTSLFFYGWWNPVYLILLVGSILINFWFGSRLARKPDRGWLITGIVFNLGLLGYFKYAGFFVSTIAAISGSDWQIEAIVLPLAISFFTFQQIAFLVDAYRSESSESDFLSYCLFVTFFPQLIAGPIVHHKQMLPQFARPETFTFQAASVSTGVTVFFLGLFKKVVLADSIAVYGSPVFAAADAGAAVTFFEAWGGALAYTFQLYFDFSGYSDMAIGLALIFGIRLPVNFESPYKAVSISDFWRRWHITLSTFLRDYLYIALGGNRQGPVRRYINLALTMLLGGLWHGAGWTFVIWGGLHGLYLIINHAWRRVVSAAVSGSRVYGLFAWALTFLCVVIGWVFFRAESLDGALSMLAGMSGLNGAQLDVRLAGWLSVLSPLVDFKGSHAGAFRLDGAPWILALGFVAFFMPNVRELVRYQPPGKGSSELTDSTPGKVWHWKPSLVWTVLLTAVAITAIFRMNRISEFLYFQF
ncbi:MAG: MBOAT family protein [Gammaproteobacteria bacterium]